MSDEMTLFQVHLTEAARRWAAGNRVYAVRKFANYWFFDDHEALRLIRAAAIEQGLVK